MRDSPNAKHLHLRWKAAAGEPLCWVYMDFGLMDKKDTLYKYVEDLSKLAKSFGRSANQYRNVILNGWKLREQKNEE